MLGGGLLVASGGEADLDRRIESPMSGRNGRRHQKGNEIQTPTRLPSPTLPQDGDAPVALQRCNGRPSREPAAGPRRLRSVRHRAQHPHVGCDFLQGLQL